MGSKLVLTNKPKTDTCEDTTSLAEIIKKRKEKQSPQRLQLKNSTEIIVSTLCQQKPQNKNMCVRTTKLCVLLL